MSEDRKRVFDADVDVDVLEWGLVHVRIGFHHVHQIRYALRAARDRTGELVEIERFVQPIDRLTQVTRYRVVPRDQLRARLMQEKKGSHQQCFDESCQIELGKALAAQKTLSTKILRVGKRCAITSSLFDLRSETAEQSALARTDCDEDSLMDAMDRVARQFSGGDYR